MSEAITSMHDDRAHGWTLQEHVKAGPSRHHQASRVAMGLGLLIMEEVLLSREARLPYHLRTLYPRA
jgi:hypothetical protein